MMAPSLLATATGTILLDANPPLPAQVAAASTRVAASGIRTHINTAMCLQCRADGRIAPCEFMDGVVYGGWHTGSRIGRPSSRQLLDWKASTRTHIRPANRASTTSLDLCAETCQFLLAGSKDGLVSIFDLWETNRSSATISSSKAAGSVCHRPIQQATLPIVADGNVGSSSSVTAVQWFPSDNGIFFAASAAGTVSLWDTGAMVPVLQIQPFQFTEFSSSYALRCMDVSSNGTVAATGSNGSATVKLVDFQSGGAASHSLTPPGKGSPVNSHTLASCGGGKNVYIWDIRRAMQPLAVLDTDYQPHDNSVSKATSFDGSRWKMSREALNPASATNLSFTRSGQHLVTVCGMRREIAVWDLCTAGAPTRRRQTFTNITGGTAVGRSHIQPLLLTATIANRKQGEQGTLIWATDGQCVHAYAMSSNAVGNGKPVATLSGHLGNVRTLVATRAPMQMITAADDGLILVWDRKRVSARRAVATGNSQTSRKRRSDDVDSW